MELTFSAAATAGAENVVPNLSWSTTPPATKVVATGDWSGNKAASGNEKLAAIKADKTYTLTALWPAVTEETFVNWDDVTHYTNGQPIPPGDLIGYTLIYSQQVNEDGTQKDPKTLETTVSEWLFPAGALGPGYWYFATRAKTKHGELSDRSEIVHKDVPAPVPVTITRSVSIVVYKKPKPPTGLIVK